MPLSRSSTTPGSPGLPGLLRVLTALLGGAVAWTVHLLLAYLIAEFGCLTALRQPMLLEITGVAWAILLVSVLTLGLAVASTLMTWQTQRTLAGQAGDVSANLGFIVRFGVIANVLFTFVILVQSVPIFFYLGAC